MKRSILYSLLGVIFIGFTNSLIAQRRVIETVQDGNTLIMLTPQYLFVDQFRVEIDKKIGGHYATFAPHYVQNVERYRTHHGFGLMIAYKYFLKKSLYISAGFQSTAHFFASSAKDDLTSRDLQLYRSTILQYGPNFTMGSYFRLFPNFFGDLYGGFGYRLIRESSDDQLNHTYGDLRLDAEYRGLMIVMGIRFGVML